MSWRGYASYGLERAPDYVYDPHASRMRTWIRKISWAEEKRAQEILGLLIGMGYVRKYRGATDTPELGWLDHRFDPLLRPHEVRCCRTNDKWPSLAFQRRANPPARWCYNKAVLRVGQNWYCLKHSKTAPLPPWEGAPDLHYRPHSRSVGKDDFRAIEGPYSHSTGDEVWVQKRVEQELECTTDQLWGYVIGAGYHYKLPTMGGFRQSDGTMSSFSWLARDVIKFRDRLRNEAAKKALLHMGVEHA